MIRLCTRCLGDLHFYRFSPPSFLQQLQWHICDQRHISPEERKLLFKGFCQRPIISILKSGVEKSDDRGERNKLGQRKAKKIDEFSLKRMPLQLQCCYVFVPFAWQQRRHIFIATFPVETNIPQDVLPSPLVIPKVDSCLQQSTMSIWLVQVHFLLIKCHFIVWLMPIFQSLFGTTCQPLLFLRP